MPTAAEISALLPVLVLIVGGSILLLSEVFLTSSDRRYQVALSVATSLIALYFSVQNLSAGPDAPRLVFNGAAANDGFSAFISATVCVGMALSALVSAGFLHRHGAERGEFHGLMLLGGAGMILLGMSADLMMIFISLEVMSVATYALAAWLRRGARPSEAAFKYFMLGAFSSALYLYGTALIYGATGSTRIAAIAGLATSSSQTLLLPGLGLVAVGFAFKVAAVPFHMWAPDVYEGSPTPVTAFMAVGVKAAAFAALVRAIPVAFAGLGARWEPLLMVLAGLTMLGGNLMALPQRNVKRMLAYSSIAHAGYLLVAVTATYNSASRVVASEGLLFYLLAYTFAAVGAFGTVAALERREIDLATAWDLDRFAGLGKRRPVLALCMTAFMLSMAGVPPTVGFMGKLFIFKAAIDANLVGLAVLGMLTSAVGAYYYLRVVVYMYFRSPEPAQVEVERSPALEWGLAVACVFVIVLGVGPETVVKAAHEGARMLW